MKDCNHFRMSGRTQFVEGGIEADCWGCNQKFLFTIEKKPPMWLLERLKGILTAVKIFESVNNDDGTTSLRPIVSDCCKYK